jgi:alpha-L-fucosidase 2
VKKGRAAALMKKENKPGREMRLWYQQPAEKWVEALPVGNGRLGGMVSGAPGSERIQLNEDTLWSGFPRDTNNYDAYRHLEHVRELVKTGRYTEAERIIEEKMLSTLNESYQPLGNLYLRHEGLTEYIDYERELDLDTAVAKATYSQGNVQFHREIFVSAVNQVMVIRMTASKPARLNITASLDSLLQHNVSVKADSSTLVLKGKCPSRVEPSYVKHPNPIIYEDQKGMKFEAVLKAVIRGGTVEGNAKRELEVRNADEVMFLLTAATSFNGFDKDPFDYGKDPAEYCAKLLKEADSLPYEELRSRHINDYQKLFHRMDIDLGITDNSLLPTDQRLKVIQDGADDPQLAALLFQYGRYLLISCSRPETQPANLQGIWNDQVRPPWSSNYTTNINAEMNYWPAELCNLSECHEPLLKMIEELQVTGRRTARIHYNARGWTAHGYMAVQQPRLWPGLLGFVADGRSLAVRSSLAAL